MSQVINLIDARGELQTILSLFIPSLQQDEFDQKYELFMKQFDGKATIEDVYYAFIIEVLEEAECVIDVDWKWDIGVLLEDVKKRLPSFCSQPYIYEIIDVTYDANYNATGTIRIGEKEYKFADVYMVEFIEDIVKESLENLSCDVKLFKIDDGMGDAVSYAFVTKEGYQKLHEEYAYFPCSWDV